MTDKLTDLEIKKVLEECIELRFDDTEYATVRLDVLTNTLDLITRQQAELEELKEDYIPKLKWGLKRANEIGMGQDAEIERLKYLLEREENKNDVFAKQFYKLGAKEFAERFSKELSEFDMSSVGLPDYDRGYEDCMTAIEDTIDNLVKEMVGE